VNTISRHIINQDIVLYQLDDAGNVIYVADYEKLCDHIDYWKAFLIDRYDARAGQLLFIDCSFQDIYYYSMIFAAAELGLVIVLDMPHAYCEQDLDDYKMNMHGKIDYVFTNRNPDAPEVYWDWQRNLKLAANLIQPSDYDQYQLRDPDNYRLAQHVFVTDHDAPFIRYASSGTTGDPRLIINSHKKVYDMSKRLVPQMEYKDTDSAAHIMNMFHGVALCYHFLPSFMVIKKHYLFSVFDTKNSFNPDTGISNLEQFVRVVDRYGINAIKIPTTALLEKFVSMLDRARVPLKLSTLFQISPLVVSQLKAKNIHSVKSLFGDTTIAVGLFTKTVYQDQDPDSYDITDMGMPSDDFFEFDIRDQRLWIRVPSWQQDWQTSNDIFEHRAGRYYFRGRANTYKINGEWVSHNQLETTVNLLFGGTGANIVIDEDLQKIYLAIWKPNQEAEQAFLEYLQRQFKNIGLDYVLRGEEYDRFFNSRKIDSQKIRQVCRDRLQN